MGASMATVDAITKDIYGPKIVDQTNTEVVLTRRITKTSKGTESKQGGKFVTFPLRVRKNQGIGYRNELEQLPSAGQNGYASVRVPLRYGYGRVHMSGQTMDLVNEDYQSFASAMSEEMSGLKDSIVKDTNRILWGSGNGVVGTSTAGDGVATTNVITCGTDFEGVKFFAEDMQVDVLSADGQTVKASNRKVTDVDEDTGQITIDGAAVAVDTGDIITRYGNYGREPQGLTSIVAASGSLFGLDPANEPKWKSIEDTTGGALSEAKMITMCDRLRTKGSRPSVIFTSLGVRRAYFNLLKSERRIVNTQTFEGGFDGLAFTYEGEIPVVTDVDAPVGKMWFLKEDTFKVYRRKEWDWENRSGSIWHWVTNYDAYEAMMKQYWEFACDKRNANAVMSNVTEA